MQSRQKQDCTSKLDEMDYNDFLPAALTLAHRAFAIAESLALAAELILPRLFGALTVILVGSALAPLTLAQRAFCAAAILARAAVLIFLGFSLDFPKIGAGTFKIEASSFFNASSFSFKSAARRNCVVVNDVNVIFIGFRL